MKNIFIVCTVAIVGLGIGFLIPSKPIIQEKIVEVEKVVQSECEVCEEGSVVYQDDVKEVPVDKVVIRDVIKEVPVIKEVIKEVEKIVYRDCVKEDIKVESLSIYPYEDSVKFYLNTNVETEAFLRVFPAYRGFDYNNGISTHHTLEATDLKKGSEYYYQITLITEDGFVQKSGEFLSSK